MSGRKLPEGWINTTIGDISVKCSQRVPDENEQFIYVDIGSINRELKVIENPQYLIGRDAPSRARKEIKAHDIIVSLTRPNLNAVALVSEKYDKQIASTGFEVIRPTLVESRYIFALVRSRHFIDSISGLVQGALYPAAKSSDVQSYEFPLPPLAEQKIIAEKLDKLLAQVDSTKARLEQIPQILKRFRQAIMASAVEGKLNNSDSKKWKLTKVEDLVRIVNGKSFPSTDYQNNGVKLLRPGNLHKSGIVVWTEKNTTYLPKHWVMKRPELSLKGGVLLMNLTAQSLKDEFLGRVCILNESDEVVLLNQRISAFTSDVKYNIIPYLFIYFRSPQFRNYIDTLDSGTLIKHLNIKDIKSYSLKLPSAEEQLEIVRRVEQLFAYADTIEKQANNALTRVNNLTQSILAKAFRGELTAQWRAESPDLISGENSASALLEKIKAKRAGSSGKKNSRKKA
ncbi:TPA: restriction endonuclease subunit S [Serratia marcescens]|nr:restriction endonuclease subunit S [Serratia marcescens]